ncbi:PA14 domain-containing protein [Hymenobacter rigui]|uniref:T9SS C-terminal target domain-containing protein n=1 Tax=Hymenobacter rigui TaxID=334424 RepID=A0A3R9MT82_9BACT|nr:PA14 domain-containing protein [Hymenobacter rigui]RSK49499.1 T9SS C-terminal target domain-containing protein [Hymenobacter rigui]
MKNFSSLSKWLRLGWKLAVLWIMPLWAAQAQSGACSGTDPGGAAAANGLYAEYFSGYFDDNPAFFSDNSNPAGLTRTEAEVNFATSSSFGNLLQVAGGSAQDPDRFSARLRGSLNIATAGSYTFYLTADDAAYLWLDNTALALPPDLNNALINNGGRHSVVTRSVTVTLAAGRHNVLILYGEDCCDNILVWEYEGPGITRQVVPNAALCTSVVPLPPAPQGISYSPASRALPTGASGSSGVPTVQDGGSPVTGFALGNSGSLPAGISIDGATGVLTAGPSVPQGTYNVAVSVSNANGTSTFSNAFQFLVTAPLPGGCGGTDPAGQPTSAGLYAEYYSGYFADDAAFFINTTPGLVRTDEQINFPNNDSFGNLLAVANGTLQDPDEFSLRLRGSLYIAMAGTYTFYLTADDGALLWLDNPALASPAVRADAAIDNGGFHPTTTKTVTLTLTAGLHNLLLLYGDNGLGNSLVLEYESAGLGIARQVVPGNLFCTSLQPAIPLTASLSYSPKVMRVLVGSSTTSGAPAVSSASPVTAYALDNAATLPAGITINATTGQVAIAATVPEDSYTLDISVRNAGGVAVFARSLTVQVIPPAPSGCSGLDGGGRPASSGLFAEYFPGYFNDDPAFFNTTAPAQSRNVQVLNFGSAASWGDLTGVAGGTAQDPDGFSARFKGRINIPVTGTYTFYLTADDGAFLWLDNAALATTPTLASALIQNGGQHPPTTVTGTVTLAAGLHDVLVLYGENISLNELKLEYASTDAGVARQLLPATGLCSSSSNAPLPVTLTRFGATTQNTVVAVSWETAQELNSAYYVVERSANGKVFEAAGKVAAAGTTQQHQRYSYLDHTPLSGLSYYRLRQVDADGTEYFSSVVAVQVAKQGAAARVVLSPNPSKGVLIASVEQEAPEAAILEILDMRGQVVYRQQLLAVASQQLPLNLTAVPVGVYIVRIRTPHGLLTQRLLLE